MDNVFDKVGMVEPAVVPGAKRPVAKKNTGNAITKVHFNSNTKQGMIEFKDGRTLPIYTGYKAIKMTDDHELNRVRLFLATFVNPKYTPENHGTGTWYNAEFYIGKTDKYYKITQHAGNMQRIIAKGYNANEVIDNAFGRNLFHIVDWKNNFTKEKYKAYITYLKFKGVCDKYIKDNAVMIDTKSRAVKDLAKYFREHLNSGKVITLPNSDCMDEFIDNFEIESVSNYLSWGAYEYCVKVLSNVIENLGKTVYEIHEKYEYHGRSGSDVERFFGTDKKAVAKEYIETSLGVYAGELNNKLSDDYEEAHRLAKEYKDYMEIVEYN